MIARAPKLDARGWIFGAVALGVVALGAVLFLSKSGEKADEDAALIAPITTAQVEARTLEARVAVYGAVQADPSGVFTVASPRAAVVVHVFVRPGQAVRAGQTLVELADAPTSRMNYQQAVDARDFATRELARVKRMFDEHLATTDQLNAAEKQVADAEAALEAQKAQGAGQVRHSLAAPSAAVVTAVTAAAGDRVAQDASLMTLARNGGVVARLNLEPAAGAQVAAGQPVNLSSVFDQRAPSIHVRVSEVGRQTDAQSHMIDVLAPLSGVNLPIGAALRGDIVTGSHSGLVVPRASVVFDETGPHVFTVAGGAAKRVPVTVGPDIGDDIEVSGQLAAGQAIAVVGAYELEDGMKVRVKR